MPVTPDDIARTELDRLVTRSSPASITDVEHLASYNWIESDDDKPTIAVPGSPALWIPHMLSQKLQPDHGLQYIAQNTARLPSSPMEPLFRALYTTKPDFDVRPVDVVTDRNNLRKLMAFVDTKYRRNHGFVDFTMGVEMVGDTAIFCRQERSTTAIITDGDHGYGHNFEKRYTKPIIKDSTGHHRIVKYRFCDMTFVVRHEVDGYVREQDVGLFPHEIGSAFSRLTIGDNQEEDDQPPCEPEGPDELAAPDSKLWIRPCGRDVPANSTLEIKTRSARARISVTEVAPQLWLSQTTKLVRGYHRQGLFDQQLVQGVSAAVKNWETDHQEDLRLLGVLIKRIILRVRECGGRATVKCSAPGHRLYICPEEGEDMMLPEDLYAKWDKALEDEEEAEELTAVPEQPWEVV